MPNQTTYKDVNIHLTSQKIAILMTKDGGFLGGAKGTDKESTLAAAKTKVDNLPEELRKMVARHARARARRDAASRAK
jgi:hypothetical protein